MNEKNLAIVTTNEIALVKDLMLTKDQCQFLLTKTPEAYLRTRKGKGGKDWTYVTGAYVKKVLNLMFGWDWDFEIVNEMIDKEAKQCIVKGRLTLRMGDRSIVKMQYGRHDIQVMKESQKFLDLGNDLKSAATDSLKKCASEIGIAADIYAPREFKEVRIEEVEPFGVKHETQMKKANTLDELELYYDAHPEFWNDDRFKELYPQLADEFKTAS